MLAHKPFAKALWIIETCVLDNNNLRGILVSSLELITKFDKRFRVTSLPFFNSDFNFGQFYI